MLTRLASRRGVVARPPQIPTIASKATYTPRGFFKSTKFCRSFHTSGYLEAIKPFLLADIGEGITECEVVQWYASWDINC